MTHIVSKVELAECPDDGGKWAIYCSHFTDDGEVIDTFVLQDTNKARLNSWRKFTEDWCGGCQELREYGTLEFLCDPWNPNRIRLEAR